MAKPTKKQIKDAVERLKATTDAKHDLPETRASGSLEPKKSSQRIRKQGV